jgi:hypothetical protein
MPSPYSLCLRKNVDAWRPLMPPTTPHLPPTPRPPPIAPDVLPPMSQTPHAGHLLPSTPPAHILPLPPPPPLSPPARTMTSPLPLQTPTPSHTARPSAAANLQPRGPVEGPGTYTPAASHPWLVLKGLMLNTISLHNPSIRRRHPPMPVATMITHRSCSSPPRASAPCLAASIPSKRRPA